MKQKFCIWLLVLLGFNAPAGILVQLRTAFGDMEVELFDQDKPATVANFLRYVQSGLYKDMFFHRLEPAFVVQGGGYYTAFRNTPTNILASVPRFASISNEFGVGRRYTNGYATIAMAKVAGDTNSASAEWYFNLTNNFSLDAANSNGFFTVFGRIVHGTNVLNVFRTFKSTSPTNTIIDLQPPFAELPLLRSTATYDDLIYVDISLLNVQVQQLSNHTSQISWNSVSNATNYIEFTTNFPPTWRSLLKTNGNGSTLNVIDGVTNAPRRFYRVRADY